MVSMKLVTSNIYGTKTYNSVGLSSLTSEMWQSATGAQSTGLLALYQRVAWFNRAVNIRCQAISNLPFKIFRGEQALEADKTTMLRLPALLNLLEGDLVLYGRGYWGYTLDARRNVKAVPRFHPGTISETYTPEGDVLLERRFQSFYAKYDPQKGEAGYVWTPNRGAELGPGTPYARAAFEAAGALHYIDSFSRLFFSQGAVNPTIVEIPGYASSSPAEQARVRKWLDRTFNSIRNAFKALPVSSEIKVHQIGQPVKELAMPELTQSKREDVVTALGIPTSMVFSNSANYATAERDRFNFYEDTIKPEATLIQNALNEHLFAWLDLRLEFQPQELELYQQVESEKAYALGAMYDRAAITEEEYRGRMGFVPDKPAGHQRDDRIPQLPDELPDDEDIITHTESDPDERDDLQKKHLSQWQSMAAKRFKEGKPEKALHFSSDVLMPGVMDFVRDELKSATQDTLPDVFRRANDVMALWRGYP